MKKDAHYYAILAFCRACGFKKESAHIIAYASQYVDDAKINLMYIENPKDDIEYDWISGLPAFYNMATAHSYFRINTFNYESMVNNTSAFHFIPGCDGENFTKKLRCKEESPVIIDLLKDAFQEEDLIKLGIVLHTYADTFTHQGFSGMLSKVNDIKNCTPKSELYLGIIDKIVNSIKLYNNRGYDQVFDNFIPAYGHGLALDFPDIPYLMWSYEYDCSGEFICSFRPTAIDNRIRYQRAFTKIRQHLEYYLSQHSQHLDKEMHFENFDLLMTALLFENSDRMREMNWIELLLQQGFYNLDELNYIVYQDNKWLREAFINYDPHDFNKRELESIRLADDFAESRWYQFYRAVKWYKENFYKYCLKYGLALPY